MKELFTIGVVLELHCQQIKNRNRKKHKIPKSNNRILRKQRSKIFQSKIDNNLRNEAAIGPNRLEMKN